MAYRPTLRQDAIRWLRERRTQLYVDLLTEAHAAVAINLIVLVLVSGTAGGLIRPQARQAPTVALPAAKTIPRRIRQQPASAVQGRLAMPATPAHPPGATEPVK